MKIDLYSANGEKSGDITLNEVMFGAKVNKDLMHRAVIMRLANARTPIAHTKTRGEIACSTRKIFKQKGTGNARRGAKNTNILRGGGVTHGPRNTANYSKMMPKKERRAALFSSLTARQIDSAIFALEALKAVTPKTKDFVSLLAKLPIGKKNLFVISEKNSAFELSARNIPNVKIILANYLNPLDVLWADKICFVDNSLEKAESTFLTQK